MVKPDVILEILLGYSLPLTGTHGVSHWGRDPGHGSRGAGLAEELRAKLDLSDAQMEELKYACVHHTSGLTEGSVTVRTCWDSDRLDLWRVGIRPGEPFLCTETAMRKDLQEWTERKSIEEYVPRCSREWLGLLEEQY